MFACATFAALTQTAHAQATRTWVSGVGDDANPCSRTAPCKTLAGAINKTAAGGEINALDSGDFGSVTITKSITISGDATTAGVLVSGTNGITIDTLTFNAVVHLRNLVINGVGSNGANGPLGLQGIAITQAGWVTLENIQISGFVSGVRIAPTSATPGTLNVALDNVKIRDVTTSGVFADGTARPINVAISDLHVQKSSMGVEVRTGATVDLHRAKINFATTAGILASTAGSLEVNPTAIVRLSDSTITGNVLGLSTVGGGQIISYNNNRLRGNTTDGAPTSTVYPR